jgi:general secretion pathway protein J
MNQKKRQNSQSEILNPQSRGFTLLEVLLAVSILAIILGVIYASFSTAARNVEQAEIVRDTTDLARTLVAKVSDDINNAYCGPVAAGKVVFYGKKKEQEISGNKHRLDEIYLTTLTNWRKPDSKETDLWEIGYYFGEKQSGYTLMRREKRELSNDLAPLEGGIVFELSQKITEFRLRYFNGSTWSDEWSNSSSCNLPMAVEISLALENERLYVTQVDFGIRR